MSAPPDDLRWSYVEFKVAEVAEVASTQVARVPTTIAVDRDANLLTVTFAGEVHPMLVELVADLLSPMWPQWLAPMGVALEVPGLGRLDHGDMAQRARRFDGP